MSPRICRLVSRIGKCLLDTLAKVWHTAGRQTRNISDIHMRPCDAWSQDVVLIIEGHISNNLFDSFAVLQTFPYQHCGPLTSAWYVAGGVASRDVALSLPG